VQRALDDVDPSKNSIFGNLKSNKLRAFLNKKLEEMGDDSKDDTIKPDQVNDELKNLEDMINDAKKELGDYGGSLDSQADDAIATVRELESELPKYIRGLNSRLVTSARGMMATGADEDLRKKMMSNKDQLAELLGSIAGFLPGAKQKADFGSVLAAVKKENKGTSQDTGVKEKNVAKKLDQYARQKGISPSDAMLRLAAVCEKVDSALDEVLRSVTQPDQLNALGGGTDSAANGLEELIELIPIMLEAEIENMKASGDKAYAQMEQYEKDLAALEAKAQSISVAVDKKGGKPDEKDVQEMNAVQEDLKKISQRILEDISVSKNPNLFSSSKAVRLRTQANKQINFKPIKFLDPEAPAEFKVVLRHVGDTLGHVNAFKISIGGTNGANFKIAKEIMEELPRIARDSQEKIVKASSDVVVEGLNPKKKEGVLNAVEMVANVVNAASSLLPSSDRRGDLKSVKDKIEESSESSDDSPYLDSTREYYSDSLRPPRTPVASDSNSAASKSKKRFQGAFGNVMAQKQQAAQKQEVSIKAGWNSKLAGLVQQLQNPDTQYALTNKVQVVLPEGSINQGFGAKKDEGSKDSIWNQKGILKVEKRADKEMIPRQGTLNQLILLFTAPMDGESSKEEGELLRKTLASLDSITTPDIFLDKLFERYEGPKNRVMSAFEQNLHAKAQKRVCSALKIYIVNRANQDLAYRPDLVAKIQKFIKNQVEKDSKFLAKDLNDCLALNTSSEQYKYQQSCAAGRNPLQVPKENEPIPFSKQLPFFNPQEAARQMTLVDAELFRMIRLPELGCSKWTKPEFEKSTANVQRMIQYGNKVSIWVASGILSEEDPKRRKKVMMNMLVLCQHFINMNNFHGAKSVLAGLQASPIVRLSFPGEDLQDRVRSLALTLEEKMESARSPCIPFLGSVLKELISYDHDKPNTSTQLNPEIDWERQQGIQGVLAEFLEQQRLCVYKIPETTMKNSILRSVDELQKPVSALVKLSKGYATQEEETVPEGSLTVVWQKMKKQSS